MLAVSGDDVVRVNVLVVEDEIEVDDAMRVLLLDVRPTAAAADTRPVLGTIELVLYAEADVGSAADCRVVPMDDGKVESAAMPVVTESVEYEVEVVVAVTAALETVRRAADTIS